MITSICRGIFIVVFAFVADTIITGKGHTDRVEYILIMIMFILLSMALITETSHEK